MSTQTAETRSTAALRRRIKRFYEHLNAGAFEKCYRMIDPELRATPTCVTLLQYTTSLERFRAWAGTLTVRGIQLTHLQTGQRSRLYGNRDFALASVAWEGQQGDEHIFRERWVRDRRGSWYTRNTGLVTPDSTDSNA